MNCPKCNAEIPAGKNFCVECGEHLPEQTQAQVRKCAKCGAVIPDGKNFCVECGEHLPEQTQAQVRKCAKCGAAIPAGKNFCVECGEFLTSSPVHPSRFSDPSGRLNFWQKLFQRRLARKDYWLLILFQCILSVLLGGMIQLGILATAGPGAAAIFNVLWELVFFFAFLFLEIERLHDADKSGWNVCWILLPIIGWLILLIQVCLPGTAGSNRFGDPPQRIF